MRIVSAAAAVPLLFVLLTWVSVRAANSEAEHFDRALSELDRLTMLEAALHRDVFAARAGVLRNYDPLVRETNALDASLAHLREVAATDADTAFAIDRLATSVTRQVALVEQFKSNNSLLQNSLAYFALFSFHPGVRDSLAPVVSDLAAAMLRLTLDTSVAAVQEVHERLDDLGRQPSTPADFDVVEPLLAHGRLLHDLLPATDGVLKALRAIPHKRDQEELRNMVLARQAVSRATARQFRVLLYFISLALVGLLAYLAQQLAVRARTLRRRAAFEHVVGAISMRFISAPADDVDRLIELALAEMARCLGAERAYYLRSDSTAPAYRWSREGVPFPPGWPDQAWTVAARNSPAEDGILRIPRIVRLPPGEDRDVLLAAGLKGWASTCRRTQDGGSVLLGFDAVNQQCRVSRAGELGLLRMALDVIANALGRKSLEQERLRLEMRLQQARRLETVGALASGITHNFNNIVGAILGYTEMATEQGVSGGRSTQIIADIRRAGERARELVEQILTFARRHDAQPIAVDVQALVAEAASLLRASLPNAIDLVITEPADPAIVSGVPAQLQQVILNLCNNAAQAMNYAGRISVALDVVDVAAGRTLTHGTLAPGRHVRLAVADAGRGIDSAALERIFEPFFTTRVAGNGLGLATTRDIVREHGGALNVESTVGRGSRFEVWLPRYAPAATPCREELATIALGNGESVLLVESDPDQLLRSEEILAALGYEPVGFMRAAEALDACRAMPDRFDLLLIGHLLPMSAALDLAMALRRIVPALPILLTTASPEEFDADALIRAGISDVAASPISAMEIAPALRECLRRSDPRRHQEPLRQSGTIAQFHAASL
ncbi:MAG: two-component system VirA-like sensor kinase [Acetobacteraceae bacterium]